MVSIKIHCILFAFQSVFLWHVHGFGWGNIVGHDKADHYPEKADSLKTCSKPKYTVQFEGPICIPKHSDKDGEWAFTDESLKNCQETLKAECPEFNEAICVWYGFTYNSTNTRKTCGLQPDLKFPACQVKYRARKGTSTITWMEVFYVNQFATNFPKDAGAIVELHRLIKEESAFPHKQEDWPLSVNSDIGYAGMQMVDIGNIDVLKNKIGNEPVSKVCDGPIKQFYIDNYRNGQGGMPKGFIEDKKVLTHCGPVLNKIDNYSKPIFVEGCIVKFEKIEKEHKINFIVGNTFKDDKTLRAKFVELGE